MSAENNAPTDLRVEESGPAWFNPRRVEGLVWALVAFGIVIRLARYSLRFPLWEDEAGLAYNFIDRDYLQLLSPLDFLQVAPVGYLWLQRAVVGLIGFTEWSLRLSAITTGIASLLIFRQVSRLALPSFAHLFAVALFAVAYPLVRYSAEAKQYGLDIFFTVLLTRLFLGWRAAPQARGWLVGLTLLTPVAVFLSHASVFIAGAISVMLAWELSRAPSLRGWLAWVTANGILLGSFVAHLWLSRGLLAGGTAENMSECWHHQFPPVDNPLRLLTWLVTTHTGDSFAFHERGGESAVVFAFPFGSGNGGSTLTFLGVFFGALLWHRHQRCSLLVLAFIPLGLHLVAAALQRYPYGGHIKFTAHWIPFGTLLLGTALAHVCAWLDRNAGALPRGSLAALTVISALGAGILARDFYCPAKTRSDQRARDLARWFWFDAPHEAVVVCVHQELHRQFIPNMSAALNWHAAYACNQRIYATRGFGTPPDWSRISERHPLWCVEFRPAGLPFEEAALQGWLREMQGSYEFVGTDRFPMTRYNSREQQLRQVDHIHIHKFRPRVSGHARN